MKSCFEEIVMPRGNMPRQPSRSGRQEAVRKPGAAKRSGRNERAATPATSLKPWPGTARKGNGSRYAPLAPERVRQIIAGLDKMYPGVTCALTHRSAWELV